MYLIRRGEKPALIITCLACQRVRLAHRGVEPTCSPCHAQLENNRKRMEAMVREWAGEDARPRKTAV